MGLSLVKRYSMLRVTFNIKRAEGEPALVRGDVALRPCIRLDPGMDPHHEAVTRFSGKAPGRQEPILNLRRQSQAITRVLPPRIVIDSRRGSWADAETVDSLLR